MNLILAIFVITCSTLVIAGAESFPVKIENVRPVGVIPGQGDLGVLARSLLSIEEVGVELDTDSTEVISWALKYRHGAFPPSLQEECIILVTYRRGGRQYWQLGYMYRVSNTSYWHPATYYDPYLKWRQTFGERPSVAHIAAFLRESNYAYNEYGEREVLKVVLYMRDAELMKVLSNPVPDREKKKRQEAADSYRSWSKSDRSERGHPLEASPIVARLGSSIRGGVKRQKAP